MRETSDWTALAHTVGEVPITTSGCKHKIIMKNIARVDSIISCAAGFISWGSGGCKIWQQAIR
jgi:hypothetical protein